MLFFTLLINILVLFSDIFCFVPSLPPQIENAIVVKRLTELYTLRAKAKLSELCEEQSKIYYNALFTREKWAMKMMDASSKFQAGLAGMNLQELGNFDECLAIDNATHKIKGKYCYTHLNLTPNTTNPTNIFQINSDERRIQNVSEFIETREQTNSMIALRWAFCIPNGCQAQDAQAHLNKFFFDNQNLTSFQVSENDCQTIDTQPKLNSSDWTVIGFLIALGCVIVVSTIYDIYLYYAERKSHHQLFVAFSWYTNFQKFIKINKNPDMLPCLNGIRFLSMLWIIHGHEFLHTLGRAVVNMSYIMKWMQSFLAAYTIGSTVSVDTFFVLSGCLLMYGFLKAKAKGTPINIPLMYLHRYLRLTPAYAAMILFYATLLIKVGSGPIWFERIDWQRKLCKEYWWTALLYVQNWVNPMEMCIGQSWYLQTDMQLFIMAPLILIPVIKWPKKVPYLFGILMLIFTIAPTIIAWQYNVNAILSTMKVRTYYADPFARAGSWIVGLALGYILFNTRNRQIHIEQKINLALWAISLGVMFFIVFGHHESIKHEYYNNKTYNAFFNGLSRNIWSIALAYIIFACCRGYGGPVNWFLSLSVFQILARLTYSMYLIHGLFLSYKDGETRTYSIFSNFNVLLEFFGTVAMVMIFSLLCLMTFEIPFGVLDNLLLGGLARLFSKKSTDEMKQNKTKIET